MTELLLLRERSRSDTRSSHQAVSVDFDRRLGQEPLVFLLLAEKLPHWGERRLAFKPHKPVVVVIPVVVGVSAATT